MKLEFSEQIFEKYFNIKVHENPSSGSRVVPCGPTDGRSDMKLKVTVRSCAKASNNSLYRSPNTRIAGLDRQQVKYFGCLKCAVSERLLPKTSHPIYLGSILIPSSVLRLDLQSGRLPLGCPTKMSTILIFPHASYMPCQYNPLRFIAFWGMMVLVFCHILHILREAKSTNRYCLLASGMSTYCNFTCIKSISVKTWEVYTKTVKII
jgi:hypothetical protein